jgi:hypothetical protein
LVAVSSVVPKLAENQSYRCSRIISPPSYQT